MVIVRISELKAALSRYLDRVRLGEEVVVTDRGKPVARLVPLGPGDVDLEGMLENLERTGVVRRGTGVIPEDFWDVPGPSDPEDRIRRGLMEERGER